MQNGASRRTRRFFLMRENSGAQAVSDRVANVAPREAPLEEAALRRYLEILNRVMSRPMAAKSSVRSAPEAGRKA